MQLELGIGFNVVIYQRKVWVKSHAWSCPPQRRGTGCFKSIAERQNLPENYLEQLFATLKKAGHITSVRVHREAICFPKTLTVLQ